MKNFVLGLLWIIAGGSLIFFSDKLVKSLGRVVWAENNLGGTRQAYILGGFCLIVLGFLYFFGIMDNKGGVMEISPEQTNVQTNNVNNIE